ncbi:MAG: ABC transporter ATP-binding protein [Acidipropionibacterium sp.]|jgi:putative ABC transport system ATP-binding protein|nr:ABC transporter ATP-binding protein [Acidipropionibacterium sp.]
MNVLGVYGLHHQFGKQPEVLRGISLDIEPATMTAIMGPSGSGKTTLLNCMSGLLKPTGGQVLYRGQNVSGMSGTSLDQLRRTAWGFIFQSYNLIDALTAIENVRLPAVFDGTRMSDQTAVQALSSVGLAELATHYPDRMSGGQQQRVAIARAIATHRDVLFADEPTGALDSESGREVMDHLAGLPDAGTTVVMVTHDPMVAARAQRVVFLYDGRIVADTAGLTSHQISDRLVDLEAQA